MKSALALVKATRADLARAALSTEDTCSVAEIAALLGISERAALERVRRALASQGGWEVIAAPSQRVPGRTELRVAVGSLPRRMARELAKLRGEESGVEIPQGRGVVLSDDDSRLALRERERLLVQGLFLRHSSEARRALKKKHPEFAHLLNFSERPGAARVFDLLKTQCIRCLAGPLIADPSDKSKPRAGAQYRAHRFGRWRCENPQCGFALSYATVRRIMLKIPPAELILATEGVNAFRNKFGCYMERDWSGYGRSEYVNGDHHECDIRVYDPAKPFLSDGATPRIFSPWLSAWQDLKTSVVSYRLGERPNAELLGLAFRDYVIEWGKPAAVLTDNGKDYLSRHFTRLCSELQIEIHNTLPSKRGGESHAKSKPIERFFGEVERGFVKHQPGWRGSYDRERPPELWLLEKEHAEFLRGERQATPLLSIEQFRAGLRNWVRERYLKEPVKSLNAAPRDAWAADSFPICLVSERALDVLLWETDARKVGRNGVAVAGFHYWNQELFGLEGLPCTVRVDPSDISRAVVQIAYKDLPLGWPKGKDKVVVCYEQRLLGRGATKEDVAEGMRRAREQRRVILASVEAKAMLTAGVKPLDQVLAEKAAQSGEQVQAAAGGGVPVITPGHGLSAAIAESKPRLIQPPRTPRERPAKPVFTSQYEREQWEAEHGE